MTAQDTPTVETTEVPAEESSKKKFSLPPIVKKALIWGGAAVGLIAVTALTTAAAVRSEEREADIYVLTPAEEPFEITTVGSTETTD